MRLLVFNLATDADDPILGFTTRWIQVLAESVESLDVITMRAGRLDVPANVRVYSVGKEKGYGEFRRALEFYRILLGLLWRQRYDGCFAHMMPLFAVMAGPLLRFKRIPGVLWYAHKSVTITLRLATLLVERVVTASPESFRIPSQKVRVIGHGIDTEKFVPRKNRLTDQWPFKILTVSRLSPSKRIDLLLEAARLLRQQAGETPFTLTIVGGAATDTDRDYVQQLRRYVQHAQLQEVVEFVGEVPFHRVTPYYQNADCFVNLSETGAVDKAVLEAMSCGNLILANPVFAGVVGPELVPLCIVDWDAQQIVERLRQMIAMPLLAREQIGQHLRTIVVREHDLRRLGKRLLKEFQTPEHPAEEQENEGDDQKS